jgi:hypothetical protein
LVEGVRLTRLAVAPGADALPMLLHAFQEGPFATAARAVKAA